MNHLEAAREFAQTFDCPVAESPAWPGELPYSVGVRLRSCAERCWVYAEEPGQTATKFVGHVLEELAEFFEAYAQRSPERTLDALVDAQYCLSSLVLALGFGSDAPQGPAGPGYTRFDRAFTRVHAANLAKAEGGVRKNAAGKVLKPEGWRAPDLRDLADPC